jgi:hypothetical protein
MQQGHNIKNLIGPPRSKLQALGQLLQKGVFDGLHLAIGAHQVRRQGQNRFSLVVLQGGDGLVDQLSPTLLTQLGEQLLKQLTHLLLRTGPKRRAVFELGAQGMGFVTTQLAVTADGSQADGGKGLSRGHRQAEQLPYCSSDRPIRHPVGMGRSARICIGAGGLALVVSVANQLTAPHLDPALERSSVLASLLAVGLMLIGVLWTRLLPEPAARAELSGQEGCLLRSTLPERLSAELDWGSRLLLTATPACVVLCWVDGEVWLRRGLLADPDHAERFEPGPICAQALERGKLIHLVDLKHYPGRAEFDGLLNGVPSVMVQPLGSHGLVLLGGWAPRCFSSSDQAWLQGWAERLRDEWLQPGSAQAGLMAAASGSSAPLNPEP